MKFGISAQVLYMLLSPAFKANALTSIKLFGSCGGYLNCKPRSPIPQRLPVRMRRLKREIPIRQTARNSRTTLMLWPIASQSVPAATALTIASLGGFVFDRTLPNSGILVTLCLAALASNISRIVPSVHVLYDLCWLITLPMSFVLLLMSMEPGKKTSETLRAPVFSSNASTQESRTILKVGLAFFVASVGSVMGCLLSYKLCCWFPALFAVNVVEAAQVTSCLAASFVGGSINFFATAAIIPSLNRSLLTAMATADIVVMAVYFAGLSLALNSSSLKRLFSNGSDAPSLSPVMETRTRHQVLVTSIRMRKTGLCSIVALVISSLFTATARMLEGFAAPIIPGTSYAFLAVTVPLFMRRLIKYKPSFVQQLRQVAEPLSGLMFLSLFAAIGVSVDLRGTFQSGPSCLMISLIALITHAAVALFGCLVLVKGCRLEEVLVASNAAIGGPATAAAFCGQCGTEFALAGTVWGVVGYALGTTLGTMMYRLLVP